MTIRHRRETGDVPPVVAAHHMGCASVKEFEAKLPELLERGFPPADATTGNFDLDAIRQWRRLRHPQLFTLDRLPAGPKARDAKDVVRQRLTGIGGG
jgi:hypothetical protein